MTNNEKYRVTQKKAGKDFSCHYWHKYLTHMKNKVRYGLPIISILTTMNITHHVCQVTEQCEHPALYRALIDISHVQH